MLLLLLLLQVVGQGNVAIDVARMLLAPIDELVRFACLLFRCYGYGICNCMCI